jgi:hypothetical protein
MALEHHKELLSYLCRVCGEKNEDKDLKSGGYQDKTNFNAEIESMYEVDVLNESDYVYYPRNICASHRTLLYSFRRCERDLKSFGTIVNVLHKFEPHDDNLCRICNVIIASGGHDYGRGEGFSMRPKQGRPLKKKKTTHCGERLLFEPVSILGSNTHTGKLYSSFPRVLENPENP